LPDYSVEIGLQIAVWLDILVRIDNVLADFAGIDE
jgi:hypothetical protein